VTYRGFTVEIIIGPTQIKILEMIHEKDGVTNTELRKVLAKCDSSTYKLRQNGFIWSNAPKKGKSTEWHLTRIGANVVELSSEGKFTPYTSLTAFNHRKKKDHAPPKPLEVKPTVPIPGPSCFGVFPNATHFPAATPGSTCGNCGMYVPNPIQVTA